MYVILPSYFPKTNSCVSSDTPLFISCQPKCNNIAKGSILIHIFYQDKLSFWIRILFKAAMNLVKCFITTISSRFE